MFKRTPKHPTLNHFLLLAALLLAGGLAGCLDAGKGDGDPASSTDNVQEWYFLSGISGNTGSGEIQRFEPACGEEIDHPPVHYRLRGDTLDLGWQVVNFDFSDTVTWESEEEIPADTFWFGGVYVRLAGAAGSPLGNWKLVDHRPWDAASALSPHLERTYVEWGFLYEDEELRITSGKMTFSYPQARLYGIRWAEYSLGDDADVSFQYVGKDSVRITRAGETASLKHRPFISLSARSTNTARPPLDVGLADSCAYANTVVDTSWVHEVIWGDELPGDELEKAGIRRAAARRR
jgi:hypothetical protein